MGHRGRGPPEQPSKPVQPSKRAQTDNFQVKAIVREIAVEKLIFRGRHGGVEKRGGWKTSRMTQKGFWTPPRTVRFPPPSGVSTLFFLYKDPRQSRPEALLEGSKNFRESAFSGTFSSPHTFCTPPISRPKRELSLRFESLAFVGGHISPRNTESSPDRPCVRCAAIRITRLAFIRLTFVPRGTAEWLARVDRVR